MTDKNTYHLLIELRDKEYEKLMSDLALSGLSRSTYIRKLIMGENIKPRPTAEIARLYTEVNRLGNNVNQIARTLNQGLGTQEDISTITFLLHKIYDAMIKVADK